MDVLGIGQCLDYIQEYIDHNDPKNKNKKAARNATQADFDNF